MIRVLLADDQALVRAGFRVLLEVADDVDVVGEAATGEEAVRLALATKPDVVLMDIRMPRLDGIQATRQIVAHPRLAQVRVLILTTFDADEYVFEALRAGASGFLVKDTAPEDLLQALRVVAAGEALLSPSVTRRLIAEFAARTSAPAPAMAEQMGLLTEREGVVLQLIASGKSNSEVAGALVLSEATVKTHVSRILSKLDCRDRAQLVVFAYESGLITPGRR